MAWQEMSPQAKVYYREYFQGHESRELRRIAEMNRLSDGQRDVQAEAEKDARECEEAMATEAEEHQAYLDERARLEAWCNDLMTDRELEDEARRDEDGDPLAMSDMIPF